MPLETNTTPPKSPVRRSLRLQKRAPSVESLPSSPKQNSVKNFRTGNTKFKEKLKESGVEISDLPKKDEMSNTREISSILPVIEEHISLQETIETPIETLSNLSSEKSEGNVNDLKEKGIETTNCTQKDEEVQETKEDSTGHVEKADNNNTKTELISIDCSNLKSEQLNGFKEQDHTEIKNIENETKKLDINDQIAELLMNVSDNDSESHHNSFLDSMAEEGEEDTPSEGSNDIIEVGEEINTTESELSSDDSYENNSFIDDEENHKLLSGEEFDISLEDCTKRRRIIELSSGSDDGIVKIVRKKKCTKKKKSRIIRLEDSSDDEIKQKCEFNVMDGSPDLMCSIIEDNNSEKKNEVNVVLDANENENEKKNIDFIELNTNEKKGEKKNKDSVELDANEKKSIDIAELDTNEIEDEKKSVDIAELDTNEKEGAKKNEDIVELDTNVGTSTPNNSCQNNNKKIIVLENIRVQDSKELAVKVNNILTSICTEIKNVSSSDSNLNIKSSPESAQNLEKKTEKLNKTRNKSHQKRTKKRNRNNQHQNTSFHINRNYFKFNDTKETCAKKSKKRKRKVFDSGEGTLHIKKPKIVLHNGGSTLKESNDGWREENVVVKPSMDNVKQKDPNQVCKFNAKDFKGLMLYDQKRVRRMDIRHLFRKIF